MPSLAFCKSVFIAGLLEIGAALGKAFLLPCAAKLIQLTPAAFIVPFVRTSAGRIITTATVTATVAQHWGWDPKAKRLESLARPEGFEPPTLRSEECRNAY
jgi:hypothetical protein